MKSEPKKDGKQRIIMENKGIKNDIVRRQTKQIIRQSKAKLSKTETDEENEQKAIITLLIGLNSRGKRAVNMLQRKANFCLKGKLEI